MTEILREYVRNALNTENNAVCSIRNVQNRNEYINKITRNKIERMKEKTRATEKTKQQQTREKLGKKTSLACLLDFEAVVNCSKCETHTITLVLVRIKCSSLHVKTTTDTREK